MSHSYIKNTPDVGKKTALKLLNKYADNFYSLKEENAQLKLQIEDLNSNLKINKSIIDNFFSKLNPKEKESTIISKIQQENFNLYNQNENLRKKNSELTNKIYMSKQTYLESTIRLREENEHLKTKIFMYEQLLQKKENLLKRNKKGITLYNNKEIYVTNPSKLIIEINNELINTKEKNKKLEDIIKDSKIVIDKYEDQLMELQNENQVLRQEYKMHIFSTNRERETLMSEIQKERIQLRSVTEDNAKYRKNKYHNKNNGNDVYDISSKIKENKHHSNKTGLKNNLKQINDNFGKSKDKEKNKEKEKNKFSNIKDIITTHGKYLITDPNRLKKNNEMRKKNFVYGKNEMEIYNDNYFLNEIEDKQYEHEEFIEIIKSVGLTLEKYEQLTKVKYFSEITEIIEMLLNLIKEKENVINILQRENDNLNANNFKLNKDNMFLFSQNINLKKELSVLNDNISNIQNNKNELMPLNTLNKINLEPKIKNSMHNYKEYINQKQKKLPTDKILNIQRVIIESSLDKECSTLKQKFEKEKDKIIDDKTKENKDKFIPNGLSIINEKENDIQNNLFVKPILQANEDKIIENKNENVNINIENEKNQKNKKIIGNNMINFKNNNNKYMGTIISVTSSEFREGCKGLESFMSTIKFDDIFNIIILIKF
jgi:hypothetical protein